MARTVAVLPAGSRITDYISLGVVAKFIPVEKVHEALNQAQRASVRERDLPSVRSAAASATDERDVAGIAPVENFFYGRGLRPPPLRKPVPPPSGAIDQVHDRGDGASSTTGSRFSRCFHNLGAAQG